MTDGKKFIGQHVTDQTRQEIANLLYQFEPSAQINIDYFPLPDTDKNLILLHALHTNAIAPYTYRGRPFERVDATTTIMSQGKYQQLLLERVQKNHSWEKMPAVGVDLSQLDQEQIEYLIRSGVEKQRIPSSARKLDVKGALVHLGLQTPDGVLSNAAVVLFGKEFLPNYPQCLLRMARFKGIDKSEFIDSRQVHGNAFNLLDEALAFQAKHLPVSSRILPDKAERLDEPLFPLEAIREALVNAICHRDYTGPGGAIYLAIYDDRMEITSHGKLPSGIEIPQLKLEHSSHPRNPLIANAFYLSGYIEQWGRGTLKMIELCTEKGHLEPQLIEQGQTFCVRFLSKTSLGPLRQTQDSLSVREQEIMRILSRVPEISLRELLAQMDSPPASSTVRDVLYRLKKLDLIHTRGHGKSAVWYLNK
ncbi:MAG: BlaI/MecI/CopY family transcriptional regulator [Chlamydiia bacterium]|nr:BlaI/MecI/CopY family transcriptional regulator [Chlamydiia bacterium]